MTIVVGIFLFIISTLLFVIGRRLRRINNTLNQGKKQLEEYLTIILEPAVTEEEMPDYSIRNEEKQILWSMEEKEQLFNEVLQEMFQ